jgi:hypothetical protein
MTTIINLQNPQPILQQDRSNIVTNPFIPNVQKERELETINKEASDIIEKEYNKNKTSSILNQPIKDINKNIAGSVIGILDDLFNKPDDTDWTSYIQTILQKDQRYAYIGILFILIAVYSLIVYS